MLKVIFLLIMFTLELVVVAATPAVWGEAEIRASHIVSPSDTESRSTPVFAADPMNLFLIVEAGDQHVTLLDGDKFEPIHRFSSRPAQQADPIFSSNGRYVYFISCDGWISKFDIYTLKTSAEIRVSINARNAAITNDDKYLIIANYSPHNLVVLNTSDLNLVKIIPTKIRKGESSRVAAVYNAAPRNTFVAVLKDAPEVWEISYEDPPPAGFGHWTHDYREDSGDVIREMFPVRRIKLASIVDDFFFDQEYVHVLGVSGNGEGQVVDLDLGRKVAALELSDMPLLGSGATWRYQDTTVLAIPNQKDSSISIIDIKAWRLIKNIQTTEPVLSLRSQENTPYAWADVFSGEDRDIIYVIDKQKQEIIKSLRPAAGKISAHVEFTKDGSHALVSIREQDGALVIYDAKTLKEVKRLPMRKPVGTYNIYSSSRH